MKILALVLLFLGEAITIYAEEIGAKLYGTDGSTVTFAHSLLEALIPLVLGALCLIMAYTLGLRYVHNIWIISAVSFASILLVEPLFDFFYIGQTPTLGAGLGMIFAVLGICSTLLL
jgi:mannose/fructose/N-acetylgalactosamine-specific phosphotransferase system component IID